MGIFRKKKASAEELRPYAFVTLTDKCMEECKKWSTSPYTEMLEHLKHPNSSIIFIGEIPNMLGHGIFLLPGNDKPLYVGAHISEFRELTENEI